MVYSCVPGCKSILYLGIHLTHLGFNAVPNEDGNKERYHAWLPKIRRDPVPVTTSLIEKCSCQLQGVDSMLMLTHFHGCLLQTSNMD